MTRRPAPSPPTCSRPAQRNSSTARAKSEKTEDIEDDGFITVYPAPFSSRGRTAPPASLLPPGGAPTDTPTDTEEPGKD